jgi:hypothetical protein
VLSHRIEVSEPEAAHLDANHGIRAQPRNRREPWSTSRWALKIFAWTSMTDPMRSKMLILSVGALVSGSSVQAQARPRSVPAPAPATQARIETVAASLRELVADPRPEAGRAVARAVQEGLPPAVLAVVLDALLAHPRADLAAVVRMLASDRRLEVRGRALVAWAELGGADAVAAIAAASDDLDPRIRRLAWALATRHPSPAAEEIVHDLLARDPGLAEAKT